MSGCSRDGALDAAEGGLGLALSLQGQTLRLLPGRAAWLPQQACLLVADAHLGKAAAFRRHGVAVPETATDDTLSRLESLVRATRASEVVFLGDLLHARASHSERLDAEVLAWRRRLPAVEWTLVRGNHDDRAGDPPATWGMAVVDEPWHRHGLALCHHPQRVPGLHVLAGHLHPGLALGRGMERLRLPCFHFTPGLGVLPAFGSFTGLHIVEPAAGDRVFVVAGERVREVPLA